MGAFATDQSLSEHDLQMLKDAVQGEKPALLSVCRRFRVPLLAAAIRSGADLKQASACVEPLLSSMCRQLLAGDFPPQQWSTRLLTTVSEHFRRDAGGGETYSANPSSLSSLGSIPRLARRRSVRASLAQLPLSQLTAILLRYLDHASPHDMVGLVAETEHAVSEELAAAHDFMLQQMRAELAAGYGSPGQSD